MSGKIITATATALTASTAATLVIARCIVSAARPTDVARLVIRTAALTCFCGPVIRTAALADMTGRVIAPTALADMTRGVIRTLARHGGGGEDQGRECSSGKQAAFEQGVGHFKAPSLSGLSRLGQQHNVGPGNLFP